MVAKPCLVDIGLHGDRHARKRTQVLVARDRGIDGSGLRQHVVGAVIDHGIDGGIDRVEPGQRGRGRLFRRNLFRPDQGSEFGGRQTPEVLHGKLRIDARLVAPGKRHHGNGGRRGSAETGEIIGEIGDLVRRHRLQRFGHGAVIAMTAVVLVFAQGPGEVVLALIGDARDVILAGEVGVVAGVAVKLLRQRLAPRIRTGSPASAGGAGFGKVPMKSEKARRSSSVNAFAISFIGSNDLSFSRNMKSWINA